MSNDISFDQLKKLWTLNLIVQTGSLKKAATQSKVSPSAISQTLSSLERSIGQPLIIRNRGSVEPTETCRKLLESVTPAFELLSKLSSPTNSVLPKLAYLNIGAYESLAVDVFPSFLKIFRDQNPQAKLHVFTARTAKLLSMVRKGELCSALVVDNGELEKFYSKVIYTDRMGIYIGDGHDCKFEDILEGKIAVLRGGSDGLPFYLSRYFRQFGTQFRPVFTSDSFESLRQVAISGELPAILPHRIAMRTPGLVEIENIAGDDHGNHKITLISQPNCDIHETNYITEILKDCAL